ncbi:MAG: type III pantothenate kinase [Lysobacter sp.]|nr:type III pantothenate kinase [Lysobacter sp.]
MTTFLFDLGNTRLKYAALHDDGGIGEVVAVAHDGETLPAGWDAALPTRFDAAALTTVGSATLRTRLLDALAARCGCISIARTVLRFGDLRIAYPQPETLGADRFLAMLGARARDKFAGDPGPWLVVGIGTAITLDLIDAAGLHRGGRIAPSPALMRAALHARATQLPEHGGEFVAFADNTPDALRSGCDGAALALIRDALDAGTALLGATPRLLLHGGGVDALPGLDMGMGKDNRPLRAPALVLEGLAAWARMPA